MNAKKIAIVICILLCSILAAAFLYNGVHSKNAKITQNKTAASTYKRNSDFTKKGTGPLYWSTYEYQFVNNQYMPEDKWKANIDWVADNFKQYGYNMVCTDGWIESSTKTNENGYIISHNNSWVNDWKYWADYTKNKGLNLGVYYNPLWVSPAAAADNNKTVVGTKIPVHNIVDTKYKFPDGNYGLQGDRFGYSFGNGDKTLYWIDVTKPGAKEYVQGYVKYFKNMGIKFLRIDFLSWYENGEDKGKIVGKNHGRKNYETALKWIEEAAGNDMEISLVMPHLNNNGQTELKYGDMARINEDVAEGGWNRFSRLNRGIKYDYWSQYSNPFDGLIYWSKYFGKNKLIPDADMLRLNTFSSDAERITAVSLYAMAGAPIDIADEADTIGNNAWIYQNTEILDLNKQGFVGKPLKANPKDKYNSQIWTGKLQNGTYVVGLFNREDSVQKRSIDFKKVLGIKGKADVRDLWQHKNLGTMSSYGADVAPHSCIIIKVTVK